LDDASKQVSSKVSYLISQEKLNGVDSLAYYSGFIKKIEQIKIDFLSFFAIGIVTISSELVSILVCLYYNKYFIYKIISIFYK
jgi:hypothetical protein